MFKDSLQFHSKAHAPFMMISMEYKRKIFEGKVMENGMGKEMNFSNSMYTH